MFKFSTLVLASLLGSSSGSFDKYHTYEPKTKVTDHAAISYDQEAIEALVAKDSVQAFSDAKRVYTLGGNSKSVALLTLTTGLTTDVPKGTSVSGEGVVESSVVGKTFNSYNTGVTNIEVQYDTTEDQQNYMNCRVGGLPNEFQLDDGCFKDTGSIVVGSVPYDYTSSGAKNSRTMQGFSTAANTKMRPGQQLSEPYFSTFQPKVDYFGDYAYADKLISAALDGQDVSLNGLSFNFGDLDFDGRAEIVKKGTAYVALGDYVVRELEDAIDDCFNNCRVGQDTCNDDDKVAALDEAAAFYVGASQATDPDGLGNLFYALPEKRCQNFHTCSDGMTGQSKANEIVFQQLQRMQGDLINLQCEAAKQELDEILKQMNVALIQGSLRYAWIMENDSSAGDKAAAEGAIFAVGVLPYVAQCNADAADTIFNAVRIGGTPDFPAVKAAFESVYGCMGITCGDIGGLVDPATKDGYAKDAAPCGGTQFNAFGGSSASTSSLAIGAVASALVAAFVAIM